MDKEKWQIPDMSQIGRFDGDPDLIAEARGDKPRVSAPSINVSGLELDPLPSDTVREVRRQVGMTQKALAHWCGVSVRAVKSWEHRGDSSEARPCTSTARKCIILLAHDPELANVVDPDGTTKPEDESDDE